MTTKKPQLKPGDRFGAFRVERLLGSGGIGEVYEVTHKGGRYALKIIQSKWLDNEAQARRMMLEGQLLVCIRHPHVVDVLDTGITDEGIVWQRMELLHGATLREILQTEAPLSLALGCAYLRQAALGAHQCHAIGAVHRDLKPENIFVLRPEEHVKILDLGLAKLMSDDEGRAHTALTERGMVFGTPAYMSPEQALGEEVDARTDLYAAGVILFQLLTGRLPFESGSPAAILVMHVSSPPPRLVECAPHLDDPSLQALLDRALAKSRDDRYTDADALRAAIERVLVGRGGALGPATMNPVSVLSPQPAAPAATPPQGPARGRWALAVLALVVAAGLAALAWLR